MILAGLRDAPAGHHLNSGLPNDLAAPFFDDVADPAFDLREGASLGRRSGERWRDVPVVSTVATTLGAPSCPDPVGGEPPLINGARPGQ